MIHKIKELIKSLINIKTRLLWKRLKRIELHRKGAVGDELFLSGVAREIKEQYPGTRVTVYCTHPELFLNNPNIDGVATRIRDSKGMSFYPRYEPVFRRNKFYNKHILEIFCEEIGIRCRNKKVDIFLTDEEKRSAQDFFTKNGPYLVIQTRAGNWTPNKGWTDAGWQQVINRWSGKFKIVHLGLNNEPVFDNVIRLCGKTSIRDCAVIISRARLVISVVSLSIHLANGVDTPAVVIYGGYESPSSSAYANTAVLTGSTKCSPCWMKEKCPYGMECMKEITVEMMNNKIGGLL